MKGVMFKQKFWLTVFTVYQIFSSAMIATGIWPQNIVYVNLAIQLGAILAFDLENAVYSVILSVPFYLAVPNPRFDSLSAWRFGFALLFVLFWLKHSYLGKRKIELMPWDAALPGLLFIMALSVLFEPFKTVGARKFLFVLNVYLIYVVTFNVIKTRQQIRELIRVIFLSLAMIVLLGYVQFAITFATSTYYFWQYWATMISRVYYGQTLADTLTYSNSWFTFAKNAPPALRMFSILPDSHAFAVIAMFSIPYAAALLFFVKRVWQKVLLWIFIALASAAIVFSGTRGVWAGILAPLALLLILFARHLGRKLIRPMFVPLLLFFVFLAASPLIQKSLASVRSGGGSANFLQRAGSIYDLNDSSNAGRIAIWKNTLKFWLDHPFLGAGFGNFVITLDSSGNDPQASYQQLAQQKVAAYNLPKQYVTAHNLYLDFLAETGILGLAALLYYFRAVLAAFWKFFRKHYLFAEDGEVFLAVNLGLYVLWLLAYSFVDGTLLNDRVLIYFFISLAVSGSIMRVYLQPHAENRN